jgi:C4-dicarboxylate-specific signal transduction histidine kinase
VGEPGDIGTDAVLIVDDDATVRTFLARVVERSGLVVEQAATVTEALERVERQRYLAAFIDKHLPDGSGIDVMAALHARQAEVPVVMVTAFLDAASAVAALRAGATDVLSKPFDFRSIRERIEGLLERARHEAERRRLDALLVHGDRLATLGTLSAAVAHELTSPLTVTLTSFDLLCGELARLTEALGETHAAALARCLELATEGREASHRMRAIAADLRRYVRRDAEAPVPVDLEGVIARAVALASHATRNRVSVTIDVQPGAPRVSGQPMRFEQVVVNLLVNAAQAIPPAQRDGAVRVSLGATDDGWARLQVADNGPGVAPHVQARLFSPFVTTKPEGQGTGLGLSVVADIVRAAGGRIEHRPTPGGGATFCVLLPPAPVMAEVRGGAVG